MAGNVAAKAGASGKMLGTLLSNFKLIKIRPNAEPMIFPYTMTSSHIHFPWKYHFKNAWMFRYLIYSNIILTPLWLWIDSKVNSPEAKLAWEKKKKDDFIKEHKKEWEI